MERSDFKESQHPAPTISKDLALPRGARIRGRRRKQANVQASLVQNMGDVNTKILKTVSSQTCVVHYACDTDCLQNVDTVIARDWMHCTKGWCVYFNYTAPAFRCSQL